MKKVIMLFAISTLAVQAMASTVKYGNNTGCSVEVEPRNNGTIYYVTQEDQSAVIGVTHDLSKGTFAYCADSHLNINSFQGSQGTGIMLSCGEHSNDHATTRGRADIEIINGELSKISVDGQVKGLFRWKQDTQIECLALVKK